MTPTLIQLASAAAKAANASQTATAQLVSGVADATARHRLWDCLGLVPGAIPLHLSGFSDPTAWAKSVPPGTRWACMDIETPGRTLADSYAAGGKASPDVASLAGYFAAARAALPGGAKLGTTAFLPNDAAFNADAYAGGIPNTEWIYSQMRACSAAYAQADFLAVECYPLPGQNSMTFLCQAIQWIGMAREYGPVMAVMQPCFPGSTTPIPADLFGFIARSVAGVADLGLALWGSPDPALRAEYAASPAVAWLGSRVAKHGTLNFW
jgi:hypothetical protein